MTDSIKLLSYIPQSIFCSFETPAIICYLKVSLLFASFDGQSSSCRFQSDLSMTSSNCHIRQKEPRTFLFQH